MASVHTFKVQFVDQGMNYPRGPGRDPAAAGRSAHSEFRLASS